MQRMVAAGVDLISVHVGGTAGGTTGALGEEVLTLERAIEITQESYELAIRENPVVTHGGPFENPAAMKECFAKSDIHGYIGASGIERIPTEKELEKTYDEYKKLKLR